MKFCVERSRNILSNSNLNNLSRKGAETQRFELKQFIANLITKEQLNDLPYPVAKWLNVSGMIGKEEINTVWLSQKAMMKMKPEQKDWNEAVAEQYFSAENPAFVWKVKMNMPPFIKITGRDKFVDGKGEMLIKMFSILNIFR